jgi:hypothetical protein
VNVDNPWIIQQKATFVFKEPILPETLTALTSWAKQNKSALTAESKILRLRLPYGWATKNRLEQTKNLLVGFANELTRRSMTQIESCTLCQQEGFDEVRIIRGLAVKVHSVCYEKLIGAYKVKVEEIESSTKNIAKGYFFMALGMLLGAFINIMVMLFSSMMFALLYAIIPLFGMLFFKVAKAPGQKKVPFIIAGFTVLLSASLTLLFYWLVADSYGLTLAELLAGGLAEWPTAYGDLYTDLATSAFYGLVGVVLVWRFMVKKTNLGAAKEIKHMEQK